MMKRLTARKPIDSNLLIKILDCCSSIVSQIPTYKKKSFKRFSLAQFIFIECLIILIGIVLIIYVSRDTTSEPTVVRTIDFTNFMAEEEIITTEEIAKVQETLIELSVKEDDEQTEEIINNSIYLEKVPKIQYLYSRTIFSKETLENLSENDKNSLLSSRNWISVLSEKRISSEDIEVDINELIVSNEEHIYFPSSNEVERLWALMIEREAADQPFLGKLAVAEDIRNRALSGNYGSDLIKIMKTGYGGLKYENGKWHVYCNDKELTEISDETLEVIELVKNGSDFSANLLQIVTEMWQKEGWTTLGEKYYANGALYHYNPNCVSKENLEERNFKQIPISFQIDDHIFYGCWLPKDQTII